TRGGSSHVVTDCACTGTPRKRDLPIAGRGRQSRRSRRRVAPATTSTCNPIQYECRRSCNRPTGDETDAVHRSTDTDVRIPTQARDGDGLTLGADVASPQLTDLLISRERPRQCPTVDRGRAGVLDRNTRLKTTRPAADDGVGDGAGLCSRKAAKELENQQ